MDKGGINYRKEVWKLLKEYEADKDMTLKEVLDKIMAVPRESKNPYVGMATRGNNKGKLMRW